MMPRNILTRSEEFDKSHVMVISNDELNRVTNIALRVVQEGTPTYFYIKHKTIEAKLNTHGILTFTSVRGGEQLKFKMNTVNRLSAEYCAKRAIEVLS